MQVKIYQLRGVFNLIDGTYGENLTWTLDDDGTLTIKGINDMENYNNITCCAS